MKKSLYILLFMLFISACSSFSIAEHADPAQLSIPTPTLVRGDLTWEQSLLVSQLSKDLGVSVNEIMVVETVAVTWEDDCMGVKNLNRACVRGDLPGFRFVLSANGNQYEYHTNQDMTKILLFEE